MLFKDYGSKGDPGTWIPFNIDASELESAKALLKKHQELTPDAFPESSLFRIRALTLTEEQEIDQLGRERMEKMRMHIKRKGGDDAQADINIDRRAEFERKTARACKAVTEVSVKIGIETEDAAKEWSRVLGRIVPIGVLEVRGPVGVDAKLKIIGCFETVLAFVLDITDKLKAEAYQTDEDQAKNS